MSKLVMIGVFPPPLHGLSSINKAMKEYFITMGHETLIYDLSSGNLSRSWHIKVYRCILVIKKFLDFSKFLVVHDDVSVYMSVSAGKGQVYEILFLIACYFKGCRVYLHHHSFMYININKPLFLMKILTFFSIKNGCHLFLCELMALKMQDLYPLVRKSLVLSNSGLVGQTQNKRMRKLEHPFTIGFLSNIENDKGIFEFLELIELLELEDIEINAMIVGPFMDLRTKDLVLNKISSRKNIAYLGPLYGAEKESFWKSISVLVYPTKNDAEPLTVIEAFSYGVPVLTRSIGCLSQMVPSTAGGAFDIRDNFLDSALLKLRLWFEFPLEYQRASHEAKRRFSFMKKKSQNALEMLSNAIKENNVTSV